MIIDDEILIDREKEAITKEIVKCPYFQVVYSTTASENFEQFVHVLLTRGEDNNWRNRINSDYFDFFYRIFNRFCHIHGIEYSTIYRAAINVTYSIPEYDILDPHVDHFIEHKNFLLYLNDLPVVEKYNSLIVYKETYEDIVEHKNGVVDVINERERADSLTILDEVYPKLGRAVCFDGNYHTIRMPLPRQLRYACVFTFN